MINMCDVLGVQQEIGPTHAPTVKGDQLITQSWSRSEFHPRAQQALDSSKPHPGVRAWERKEGKPSAILWWEESQTTATLNHNICMSADDFYYFTLWSFDLERCYINTIVLTFYLFCMISLCAAQTTRWRLRTSLLWHVCSSLQPPHI